jgi:hypothetical protein
MAEVNGDHDAQNVARAVDIAPMCERGTCRLPAAGQA